MSTVQERVARGAAWLDDVRPGWRDQVSLSDLSLYSSTRCVLGQTFGCFVEGTRILVRTRVTRSGFELSDYGFNAEVPDMPDGPARSAITCSETRELTNEWRRVVHAPQPGRIALVPA